MQRACSVCTLGDLALDFLLMCVGEVGVEMVSGDLVAVCFESAELIKRDNVCGPELWRGGLSLGEEGWVLSASPVHAVVQVH